MESEDQCALVEVNEYSEVSQAALMAEPEAAGLVCTPHPAPIEFILSV